MHESPGHIALLTAASRRLSCQLLAINQAIIRGMAQGTIAKLYAGASQLGYGALHTLTKLQHDYKDLDPSLKNYLNGSHHYLMAVGYRCVGVLTYLSLKMMHAV